MSLILTPSISFLSAFFIPPQPAPPLLVALLLINHFAAPRAAPVRPLAAPTPAAPRPVCHGGAAGGVGRWAGPRGGGRPERGPEAVKGGGMH